MENFNYNLIIKNNGNEIVIKTNDVTYAIREYLRADEAGCEACLCNGFTGEVLCHNGDEPWCTDEMALMMLGYLCAEQWGEEAEDEETCPTCGGEVVDGVCQYCGNCIECECDDDPAVALLSAIFGISANQVVALHNGEGLPS